MFFAGLFKGIIDAILIPFNWLLKEIVSRILGVFIGFQVIFMKLLLIGIVAILALFVAIPTGFVLFGLSILIRLIDSFVFVFSFPGIEDWLNSVQSKSTQFFTILTSIIVFAIVVALILVMFKFIYYFLKEGRHLPMPDVGKHLGRSLGKVFWFVIFTLMMILAFKYVIPLIYITFLALTNTISGQLASESSATHTYGTFVSTFFAHLQNLFKDVYSRSPIQSGYIILSIINAIDTNSANKPLIEDKSGLEGLLNIGKEGLPSGNLPDLGKAIDWGFVLIYSQLDLLGQVKTVIETSFDPIISALANPASIWTLFAQPFQALTKYILIFLKIYILYLFLKSILSWMYKWGVKLIVSLFITLLGLIVYTPMIGLTSLEEESYLRFKNQWTQHIKTIFFNVFAGMFVFFIPIMIALTNLMILSSASSVTFQIPLEFTWVISLFVFMFAGDLYNWVIERFAANLNVEIWSRMEVGSSLLTRALKNIKSTTGAAVSVGAAIGTGGASLLASAAKGIGGGSIRAIKSGSKAFQHGKNPFLESKKAFSRQVRQSNLGGEWRKYKKIQQTNFKDKAKPWGIEKFNTMGQSAKNNLNPYSKNSPVKDGRFIESRKSEQIQNTFGSNNTNSKLDALLKKMSKKPELQTAGAPQPVNNKKIENLLAKIANNPQKGKPPTIKINQIANKTNKPPTPKSITRPSPQLNNKSIEGLTKSVESLKRKIDKK